MSLSITSPAFKQGGRIPSKYTCDGTNISPGLEWSDVPENTRSFTIIADDPDAPAGTWIHWVFYNIYGETLTLPEAIPPDVNLPDGSMQGKNSWGRPGYGGPCPPRSTHRYFFRLYALDTVLDLRSGMSDDEVLKAMKGHILAEAELMGLYSRK